MTRTPKNPRRLRPIADPTPAERRRAEKEALAVEIKQSDVLDVISKAQRTLETAAEQARTGKVGEAIATLDTTADDLAHLVEAAAGEGD